MTCERRRAAPPIRVGTSGWVYPHWRGVFYPTTLAPARWLGFYVRQFTTVEINATFYHLPSEAACDRWRVVAPPDFVYAVKASRYLTHVKRLVDCRDALDLFLARVRRLGDRLGPVLFQLPPQLHADVARLAAFARLLPADVTAVFEFRHRSWFRDEVRDCLAAHGLAFCIHDHAGLACPDWVTTDTVYHRFHGSVRSRHGRYDDATLAAAADAMRRHRLAGRRVHAYFNNDAFGAAIGDARRLARLAEASRVAKSQCDGGGAGARGSKRSGRW